MTTTFFSRKHANELAWFFGRGASLIELGAIDYEKWSEAIVLHLAGSGHYDPSGQTEALVRYGRIDRALYGLPRPYDRVLSAAYGDVGERAVSTPRGLCPDLRWRAVAPLTEIARTKAKVWATQPETHLPLGETRVAWVSEVYRAMAQRPPAMVQAGYGELRRQSLSLLNEGETLFAAAFDRIVGNERAIARAA